MYYEIKLCFKIVHEKTHINNFKTLAIKKNQALSGMLIFDLKSEIFTELHTTHKFIFFYLILFRLSIFLV